MIDPLPDCVKQGERARLIPIVAETSKEKRVASVFLSVLPRVPDLAANLLSSVGIRIGKRTKISTFTEVVFRDDVACKDRPDGLIEVANGGRTWRALVEAKIGKGTVSEEQVVRYLDVARRNGFDAVISISNEFVARADHHPVKVPRPMLRSTGLFHWPWMWVLTKAQLIQLDEAVTDIEQRFLLDEFVRFLNHPSTGVEGFTQMNKEWRDIVRAVGAGEKLRRTSEEVASTVASWFEEQRDLCLVMSRSIAKPVRLKMERRVQDDHNARLKARIAEFVDSECLSVMLQVPDAAADIAVEANLARKSVSASMRLKAPKDRKSTKARINWLLKMLKKDDPRLFVRASWPSRAPDTQAQLSLVRDDPDCLKGDNLSLVPTAFEVLLIEDLAGRFSGTRTFIEDVERIVPEFYDLVGQYLRGWRPSPPRPVAVNEPSEPEELKGEGIRAVQSFVDAEL